MNGHPRDGKRQAPSRPIRRESAGEVDTLLVCARKSCANAMQQSISLPVIKNKTLFSLHQRVSAWPDAFFRTYVMLTK